ncbi:MAG: acyl carrier protein [Bdellovibrio sp.]|nr:acyl carrier protein [Bdellovibrio sp.]
MNNTHDVIDVIAILKEIMQKQLGKTPPADFEKLALSELNLDSLERLTLMVELENRLQVKIDAPWAYELNTVSDLVDALVKLTGDKPRV